MSSISVRTAQLRDAEAIGKIYNYEVEHSTATFDLSSRSLEIQRNWIASRSGAFSVLVAEDTIDGVIGFAALNTYREKAGYRTTVENSLYVHRDHRRRGVGRLLLGELIETARVSGFHSMIARIEAQSVGSLAIHEKLGFTFVGIEREIGRKFGRWLDSVIMQKMLVD